MEARRPIFSDSIKSRYFVRRDDCRHEYIVLRGQKALGNGGLDHIYLINEDLVGLWVTSGRIMATIRRLQEKVPGLREEQAGGRV